MMLPEAEFLTEFKSACPFLPSISVRKHFQQAMSFPVFLTRVESLKLVTPFFRLTHYTYLLLPLPCL